MRMMLCIDFPLLRCAERAVNEVASPIGFEPMTRSLEGCCSIQLSYGEMEWSAPRELNSAITGYKPVASTSRPEADWFAR